MIPRSSTRRRTAVALAVLIALIICLHVVGRFGLQGPARLSVESVRAWARDPVEVVATITRWLSLILAYYLVVVVGVVAVLGERLEDRRIRRFAPSTLTAVIGLLLGDRSRCPARVPRCGDLDRPDQSHSREPLRWWR